MNPCRCVCLCVRVCVFVRASVCARSCVGTSLAWPSGTGLPVHGYLPVAGFGHWHPLEVSLVVGAIHSTEHHHTAVLLVAEGAGRGRAHCEGRTVGGSPQAQHHTRHCGLCSSVITYPHSTQPWGAGATMTSIVQTGKPRHRGVKCLPKVGHVANEWQS